MDVLHAGLFLHQLICRGHPGDEAREKCPHAIPPHIHEQYRECGNLHAVILEVKVVMSESLEM